ncbi:MAG TPA: hypothetical protein VIV66_22790 [Pyrinomonadaceae bacterium]
MKDKHIVDLLESAPLASLSEIDRGLIEAHSKECEDCRRAFQAAALSAILLQEHAAENFAPPPFFETRVLATLRERRAGKELWAFGRMWRSAGALVSSMAATVALLAVLSFALPSTQTSSNLNVISANSYSAEDMVLIDSSDDQSSDAQVLSTLYDPDQEAAK